ncbi:MAG: nuclease [Verrucomicrobia bacterium]|nr:nuclease [Verrucomicrobiota bacterium]
MFAAVKILVDDREPALGVLEYLKDVPNLQVCVQRLHTGDFVVDGAVVFERKSASDFAKSLIDGRLFTQAQRLTKQSERAGFVLEGGPSDWEALGVRREALQGALITLSLIFGLPVFRTRDAAETAHLLLYAGRQLARLKRADPLPYRLNKAKRKRTRQLRILQALPGIGGDRARNLLDHFGSVQACLTAPIAELCRVQGVGLKTAKAIRDLVC